MNGQPPIMLSFPRPGRALWAVMAVLTVVGIGCATAAAISPTAGEALFAFLVCDVTRPLHPWWSYPWWGLLTSGLLTSPQQWGHLLFSLLGFYFLGASLEQRWGGWRFVRLIVISVLLGNLATIAVSALVPATGPDRLHPPYTFGPAAAIAAIAVAWAREFPNLTVNLFLFVPIRGKALLWITIGFCVLDLIYPAAMPEGIVAPFAGVGAGLLLGGTPSPLRTLWLRVRLAGLRARSKHVRPEDVLSPPRRPRPGGPPLRVVPGGLDDVLKKRTPPKDKRYLN
jgi:membrane associated rhomboid family serine protease